MDDIELAQLEQRLRRSVVGHRPDAPDALIHFIDTVPADGRTGRAADLIHIGPRTRRSFFALATAAALIVAVVAGLGLVALRNGQFGAGPQGFSSGGWTWQRADGTIVSRAYRVANGYLGVCGANQDEALCSSPDGLSWTTPADPAIVAVEGGGQFLPEWIAQRGGVYVAFGWLTYVASTATPTPIVTPSDGSTAPAAPSTTPIWRSTDGVHWSQVDSPAFAGLTVSSVAGLANGFVALTVSDPAETGLAFTSTDGLNWTRAGQLPVQPQRTATGDAGLYIGSTAGSGETWRTTDGENWARVQVPAGVTLGVAYALSSGGFVANGMSASTNGYEILRSADGLTWTVDHGDLVGVPLGLVGVGDRLIADVSPAQLNATAYPDASTFASKAFEVWQSVDGGRTWQPLLDPSGQQMSGMVESLGDRLAVFAPQYDPVAWKIAWVGTPSATAPVPTPKPTLAEPSPVVAPSEAPTPPPTPTPSPTSASPEPTPTPMSSPLPSGGISRADAIRIAAGSASATPAEIAGASAEVSFGDPTASGRWVWRVTFSAFAGPTSGHQTTVILDYFSGSVIDVQTVQA